MPNKKSPNKAYFQDSLYKRMLAAYQKGAWLESGKLLSRLLKKYPGETELETIKEKIVLRQKIDTQAETEAGEAKKKTRLRIVLAVLAIAAITAVSIVAYEDYSVQLQQQMETINLERTLASKYKDAQNLFQAGRANEARVLLEEISAIDSDYEQLDEILLQIEDFLLLESKYIEAHGYLQEGNYTAAFETLTAIFQVDPTFMDVSILLNSLELRKNLSVELLAVAQESYFREDWLVAISNYEQAAENDASIIDHQYRIRLFDSYVAEAEALLLGQNVNLNSVGQAEEYFRNAKAILPEEEMNEEEALLASEKLNSIATLIVQNYFRISQLMLERDADSVENLEMAISILGKSLLIDPGNEIARLEYDLAKSFLIGQENVELELWEEAIESLEFVYSNNQDYGAGTARQLLYEAHSNLGWAWLAERDYSLALGEFEIAQDLALDAPDARFRLYEAHSNVAYTLGKLELYGQASSFYFNAVFVLKLKGNLSPEAEDAVNSIYTAEISAFNGNYEAAIEQYVEALDQADLNYEFVEHIIQKGDYLAQIARRYFSTVAAIEQYNTLSETGEIFLGQRLSIPMLRE